jgi:predicted transcriptional regulator
MTRALWSPALVLLCLAPCAAALSAGVAVVPALGVPASVQVDAPGLPPLDVQATGLRLGVGLEGPAGSAQAASAQGVASLARPASPVPSVGDVAGLGTLVAVLLGAFLFSRIEDERLLENPVRQKVLETIRDGPGVCIGEVRDRAGVAWGTAVYHLHRLERSGAVVSVRQKGARRYFAANTAVSRHRAGIAALAHPTAQRIAQLVHERPGIDQAGLCRALGLLNPAASKHLGRFQALGLVTAQRAGRSRLYQGTEALDQALTALSVPA